MASIIGRKALRGPMGASAGIQKKLNDNQSYFYALKAVMFAGL